MSSTMNQNSFNLARRHDLHLARKLWHISTGVAGISLYYALDLRIDYTAYALLVVALIGFGLDFIRLRSQEVNQLAIRVMGPLMRKSEAQSYSGLPFYALGLALSLLLFPEKISVLAIFFLVFADPIASFVGILYGKDTLLGSKSYQGAYGSFVACFMIAIIYGLIFAQPSLELLVFCLFAGMIGSLAEAISTKIDDNLTIPVIAGAGLLFLNSFISVY